MLTNKGERFFNPNYGANIRALLFEQNTDLGQIKNSLMSSIGNNFPTITVNALDFYPEVDNSSLKIVLNYTVNKQTDSLVIQVV